MTDFSDHPQFRMPTEEEAKATIARYRRVRHVSNKIHKELQSQYDIMEPHVLKMKVFNQNDMKCSKCSFMFGVGSGTDHDRNIKSCPECGVEWTHRRYEHWTQAFNHDINKPMMVGDPDWIDPDDPKWASYLEDYEETE